MRKWKKILAAGTGVAAAAGLAFAIVPAASASASSGVLTLCSEGGYWSNVEFPDRGGLSTYVIPPGECYGTPLGGSFNEQANVYDSNTGRLIGSTIYNGSVGETIVTIAGPSFYGYNG
jgi:hypothetical protein